MSTQFISIDQILVPPSRQRKTFDVEQIDELRKSILQHGLFHPILLQNDERTLVAGERRLRAVRSIYGSGREYIHNGRPVETGCIPFIKLADVAGDAVREAELHENIVRVDLPWQERVNAIAELHNLRKEQNPHRTQAETAGEIFGQENTMNSSWPREMVRDALVVNKFLHLPNVRNSANPKAALRVIRQHVTTQDKETAAGVQTITSPHRLIIGDAFNEAYEFPPHSFEVIVTDPPYGMAAHKFAWKGRGHGYDTTSLDGYELVAHAGMACTVPGAHCFAFIHITLFEAVSRIFREHGWDVFNTPIIWHKPGSAGLYPWGGNGPKRSYEAILFASKGKKPLITSFPDVISIAPVDSPTHPAQKPAELYKFLLDKSSTAGSRVLDLFAGTGTVFEASSKLGMIATGMEKDDTFAEIARGRM